MNRRGLFGLLGGALGAAVLPHLKRAAEIPKICGLCLGAGAVVKYLPRRVGIDLYDADLGRRGDRFLRLPCPACRPSESVKQAREFRLMEQRAYFQRKQRQYFRPWPKLDPARLPG